MKVEHLAFSPDGNFLAAGSGADLLVYGMIDGKWAQISHIEYHTYSVRCSSRYSLC